MFFGETFFCLPQGFIQQSLTKKLRDDVTCPNIMLIFHRSGMVEFLGLELN